MRWEDINNKYCGRWEEGALYTAPKGKHTIFIFETYYMCGYYQNVCFKSKK